MVRSPFKLAKGDGVTEDTATAYDQAADGYLAYADGGLGNSDPARCRWACRRG